MRTLPSLEIREEVAKENGEEMVMERDKAATGIGRSDGGRGRDGERGRDDER